MPRSRAASLTGDKPERLMRTLPRSSDDLMTECEWGRIPHRLQALHEDWTYTPDSWRRALRREARLPAGNVRVTLPPDQRGQ
jgi:hypothetical protein